MRRSGSTASGIAPSRPDGSLSVFGGATAPAPASVPAEHQGLERQHQRLEAQDQGVDKPESIDGVEGEAAQEAGVLRRNDVMVVGIRIGDATAAGGHVVQSAFEERLEKHE